MKRRFLVLVALVALMALVAGACGSDDNSESTSTDDPAGATEPAGGGNDLECATGTLTGAGSSFVSTITQQWIKDFGAKCSGATINYQSVGSGAGIQQFTAGTVDLGASDAVMKPDEESAASKSGQVLHIPVTSGGVAVEYNLKGVKDLKLSAETLAGIFMGKITKWDDAAIKADNSGVTLPSTGIQVIHRSDGSGTTDIFTKFLTAAAPSVWTAGSGKDVPWPTGQGAKGSDGVTAAVKQADGAIGYAELSFPQTNSLGVAAIKNAAGEFVKPGADSVPAALKDAEIPADLKVKVNYKATDKAAYPISGITWYLVHQKPADAAKGKLLKSFLTYVLDGGQDSSEGLFYAPLPDEMLEPARKAVESIQA